MTLKVGDTIFLFNENRRVYGKERGTGPIYAEHFEPEKIVGETPRSWLVGRTKTKVNKQTMRSQGSRGYGSLRYFTEHDRQEAIWDHQHRHDIVERVRSATVNELRSVAHIVGYKA